MITMGFHPRKYHVTLLGATGFTATFVAQILTTTLASETRWLIAGRNPDKLARLRDSLRELSPRGPVPGMPFVSNSRL